MTLNHSRNDMGGLGVDELEKLDYMDHGDRYEKYGDDRSSRKDKDGGSGGGGFHRKKICRFCADQDFVLDYKDIRMMQSFVSEHGKIVPRRISGNCSRHQRELTTSVKRARNLALVGYIASGS